MFGAVAVFVGNGLLWAVLAVVIGNIVGSAFMAYHSAQGPALGVPQLIQSRGQFGYYGALLPVALAALLYGGFFVLTAIIAGQAVTAVIPGLSLNVAITGCALISLALALMGYSVIHKAARLATWPLAISVVALSIATAHHGGVSWTTSGFAGGPFVPAIAIIATFQLTYAPYVSDYSRYLPEDTSVSSTFWATFLGTSLSALWSEVIGVVLVFQFAKQGTLQAANSVLGGGAIAALVLLVGALAISGNNSMSLYGGMLNLITAISSVREVRPGVRARVTLLLPTFVIGGGVALLASSNFIANATNFLVLLQVGFVPWGTVNLTDFYLIKHGHYDVAAFFQKRGRYYQDPGSGTHRGFAVNALVAYVVGMLVMLPFINSTWLTGSFVDSLGGADISFIVGFVVSGGLYYLLMRRYRVASAVPLPGPVGAQVTGA